MKPLLALALIAAGPATAQFEVDNDDLIFPGPYRAELIRVIDGDTVEMRIAVWPGLEGTFAIRVRGIDAPEVGRPGCEAERTGGERATEFVRAFGADGTRMQLSNVSYGTFAGRVVADIARTSDGVDLGQHLIDRGVAVEWTPDRDDVPWCLLLKDAQ